MDIVLTTFNARFIHSAFGLRYLRANLGELRERSSIHEFTINERPIDALETILAHQPKIVGVSTYIWNIDVVTEFASLLKRVSPETVLVIGGPEVSYELETQPVVEIADFVVTGQGDLAFADLCQMVLNGKEPVSRIINGGAVDVSLLQLPYEEYNDEDVAHRIIYVEASRGCPFRCEFCLSSLDKSVKAFDLDPFLDQMQSLYDRGVRQFKFVDRTFNLKVDFSTRILQFFLDRYEPGLFVHFEMIPDRLPEELREIIKAYPPGALQFEVGIQTFNPDVAKNISRRQNYDKLRDNFAYLRDETTVHVHADLIVGLPGETTSSFGEGFDQLVQLGPQEIQVGVLKRLRGTPITRHDDEFEMVYSPHPPYEILSNRDIDFTEMQEMKRFARYWDLVGNSGNFRDTLTLLLGDTPYESFRTFSAWLANEAQTQHGISLQRLTQYVFEFLTEVRQISPDVVGPMVLTDYQRPGRPKVPKFLKRFADQVTLESRDVDTAKRQARHL